MIMQFATEQEIKTTQDRTIRSVKPLLGCVIRRAQLEIAMQTSKPGRRDCLTGVHNLRTAYDDVTTSLPALLRPSSFASIFSTTRS